MLDCDFAEGNHHLRDPELLFMPASRAAALIRRRKLSPVEYVGAVLEAAEVEQKRLNCFVGIMAEQAKADAVAAERAVMAGDKLGPLHGVPISIKDLVDVKGVPTRHGSAIFADNPPAAADDMMVTRLRSAGAIVIGKTTTPEFGVKGLTDGPSFGITRNPWDLDRTPGGSSGGCAAAVAAGVAPIALGTDGAGSVRGPAACCGLVGPQADAWARCPPTPRATLSATTSIAGPLSRTITDAALMHAVLSGPSAADPWSIAGADQHRLSPEPDRART